MTDARRGGAVREAQAFVDTAKRMTRMGELTGLLSEVVRAFGFDGVTMLHHVEMAEVREPVIAYSDYPIDYLARALERRYFAHDPVLVACERSAAPFFWSELPDLIPLDERRREILAFAAQCGLEQGMTVPVNVPAEPRGSCSFALRSGGRLPEGGGQAAHWVGVFAFEQARRILGLARALGARAALTPRQLDCVVLMGRGKSEWTIGQLLGLSRDTVHEHIARAKRRYQVATRQQLVAACLADGQLTYADIWL